MRALLPCILFLTGALETTAAQGQDLFESTATVDDVVEVDVADAYVAPVAEAAKLQRKAAELQRKAAEIRNRSSGFRPAFGGGYFPLAQESEELRALEKKLQAAIKMLNDSESDEQKAAVSQDIRGLLEKSYLLRLDPYAKHIDLLQKKLDKMKQQINKRRAAKEEMVELRMKMIEAQSNGLGWPDERLPSGFQKLWGPVVLPGTAGNVRHTGPIWHDAPSGQVPEAPTVLPSR